MPSQHFDFPPLLLSESRSPLSPGVRWSSSGVLQRSKTHHGFYWRTVREAIAALNLLALLAEVHPGGYFGSSLLLEALLHACPLKLRWRCVVHPGPCPRRGQLQEPLRKAAKSMALCVAAAACKHEERFHRLVLNVFKLRDFEEMRR